MPKNKFLQRLTEAQLQNAFDRANRAYLAAHGWMVALRCELERREKVAQ